MNKKYDSQSLKYNLKYSNKWKMFQIMTHSVKPIFHSFLEPEIEEFYMSEMSFLLCIT